jgi:hypothetical protein
MATPPGLFAAVERAVDGEPAVSRNHVADIELGTRNTGVWSLLLICRALDVRPSMLFDVFPPSVLRRLRQ